LTLLSWEAEGWRYDQPERYLAMREYYPDGFSAGPHRTEICWPVFLTGAGTQSG
jgi:hypothetical protein